MKNDKIKKYIIPNLPYIMVFWFFSKCGEAYRISEETNEIQKLMDTIINLNATISKPFPTFNPFDILIGLIGAITIYCVVLYKRKNAKKWRKDVEYGSARWGRPEDIKPYLSQNPDNNVILTQTESLTMEARPKNPKYARNKNVLIVGGSGSGKTRFFLKPNLMQCHSSYCITDPKGQILVECGNLLKRKGYKIKVLNTIEFTKSMHYNPFAYIHSEKDILKLVTALISNTKGEQKGGDPFWEKSETLLYCALIGYIFYEAAEEEKNMNSLVEMINSMEVREDDETYKNAVDYLFEELEKEDPQHFAVRQYRKYKLAAGVIRSKGLLNRSPLFASVTTFAAQTDRHQHTPTHGETLGKEKNMEITYSQVGDYLLPDLKLSDPQDALPLGRYGILHKNYLREHRPILYNQLLLTERLYPLCREVDEAAAHRLKTIVDKEQAHEIILSELVYC